MRAPFRPFLPLAVFALGLGTCPAARTEEKVFRAGAAAVDITPQRLPVVVSGGFLAAEGATVHDRLHVRALVLDDGATRLAIAVADSLMMERDLLDPVKEAASRATGIPSGHILVAATHTHSAPSVMAALGTPVDEAYARSLPARIVESIVAANGRLEPAEIGWTVVKDSRHNHCRRWILRPDRIERDPFGAASVRAMMHPGHQSPNHTGPAGPADKDLSVVAVRSTGGRPIAVLANYAMHYKGAPPVSADVCGRFGDALAGLIGAADLDPPFVGILSQGTSGDSMWMDYSRPRRDPGLDGYTRELAEVARDAYRAVEYRRWVPLAMAEAKLRLRRRVPGAERLAWARSIAAGVEGRLPRSLPEVYALEALHLHREPEVEIVLQAIRAGELGIAAFPNEVFGLTGLKVKARSPLAPTVNIELAGGAQGYIPPPEQHALGGYTTWPARTAGLEVEAEPRIVETLLSLLEKVSGRPRVERPVPPDDHVRAVLASRPDGFWRLDEMEGWWAMDSSGNGNHGRYEPGVAFFLPGRSGSDLEDAEMAPSRAAHFAGGRVTVNLEGIGGDSTIELWFWNGLPVGAREVTGVLFALGGPGGEGADSLAIGGAASAGALVFSTSEGARLTGKTSIEPCTWHHVAVVRRGARVSVVLDGRPEPEMTREVPPRLRGRGEPGLLVLGGGADREAGLEGKLDDVAWYRRALAAGEVAAHYQAAGIGSGRPQGTSTPRGPATGAPSSRE